MTGSNLLTSFVILKATITCIQKKMNFKKRSTPDKYICKIVMQSKQGYSSTLFRRASISDSL